MNNHVKDLLKTLAGLTLLVGFIYAVTPPSHADSGISGIPYNPNLGAVTANSLSVTRAASASTVTASKGIAGNSLAITRAATAATFTGATALVSSGSLSVTRAASAATFTAATALVSNGSLSVTRAASAATFTAATALVVTPNTVNSVNIGAGNLILDGASTAHLTSAGDMLLRGTASGASLRLNSAGGAVLSSNSSACTSEVNGSNTIVTLPCASASGAGLYGPALNAAQTTVSGQFYAFNIVNNGTTCAVASNSPGFPTGWSAARTSAGLCTFTIPSVSQANKVIVTCIVQSGTAGRVCYTGTITQTSIPINVVNISGTATDTNFYVMIQDWN